MAAVVVGLERRTHDSLLRVMVAGSERRDVAQHDDDAGRDGHALRLFFFIPAGLLKVLKLWPPSVGFER